MTGFGRGSLRIFYGFFTDFLLSFDGAKESRLTDFLRILIEFEKKNLRIFYGFLTDFLRKFDGLKESKLTDSSRKLAGLEKEAYGSLTVFLWGKGEQAGLRILYGF